MTKNAMKTLPMLSTNKLNTRFARFWQARQGQRLPRGIIVVVIVVIVVSIFFSIISISTIVTIIVTINISKIIVTILILTGTPHRLRLAASPIS